MNKEIKKLLDEASNYAYQKTPGENSYGRPIDEHKYNQDRHSKFAELIIKECMKISNESGSSTLIVDRISERFGVKQ